MNWAYYGLVLYIALRENVLLGVNALLQPWIPAIWIDGDEGFIITNLLVFQAEFEAWTAFTFTTYWTFRDIVLAGIVQLVKVVSVELPKE